MRGWYRRKDGGRLMPRVDDIRFCPTHHWQHLDQQGRCPWCLMSDEQAERLKTAGYPEKA